MVYDKCSPFTSNDSNGSYRHYGETHLFVPTILISSVRQPHQQRWSNNEKVTYNLTMQHREKVQVDNLSLRYNAITDTKHRLRGIIPQFYYCLCRNLNMQHYHHHHPNQKVRRNITALYLSRAQDASIYCPKQITRSKYFLHSLSLYFLQSFYSI